MKVTISQVAPSPQGLRLGLRIEHEKAGWIRFGTTVLLLEDLTYAERGYVTDWLNGRAVEVEDLDQPLFSDDSFV